MIQSAEEFALSIVRRLQGAGHTAYFAGGCVRDRLMGRTPKDFDVATSAVPDQVLALFPRSQLVGAAFGVIIIREKKIQIEVATFRSEGVYSDGRHPDSVSFTTAEVDARRRDFTCNAIFYDPVADRMHDFVNGRADIEAKLLRAVGDPAHRFAEDHLRMMRAVRFAAKLGFQIEPATFAAIVANAEKIRDISKERIGEELRMMLEHSARYPAVLLLIRSGLLRQIWPAALYDAPANLTDFANSFDSPMITAPGDMSRSTAIAALQISLRMPKSVRVPDYQAIAEILKAAFVLSNEEAADIAWIFSRFGPPHGLHTAPRAAIKRLLADRRWPMLWQLARLDISDSLRAQVESRIAQMQTEGVAPAPFVTGEDLIKLGATPGKKFKLWLDSLYDRQLELEFSTREGAIAAARELVLKE